MPKANGDTLTAKQGTAIAALLSSPTIAKAAEAAKVGERTLYKWLKVPAFKAAYREAQRESFKHAVGMCQKYLPHAVQTLVKVMAKDDAPESAKVSAASALMKFGRESIELDDVVERVEKLEADTEARERAGSGGHGYGGGG